MYINIFLFDLIKSSEVKLIYTCW